MYCISEPEDNESILHEGGDFNRFLGYSIDKNYSYESGPYMLCKEIDDIFSFSFPPKEKKLNFNNYILFINENLMEPFVNFVREDIFYNFQFSILALDRILSINENIIGELNTITSNEISNLKKNNLDQVLKNRQKISKKIYQFKRFKIELEQINFQDFSGIYFISMKKDNIWN